MISGTPDSGEPSGGESRALMRLPPPLEAVEDLLEEAEDAPLGDAVDGSDRTRRLDDRPRGGIEFQDRVVGQQGGLPRRLGRVDRVVRGHSGRPGRLAMATIAARR